MRALQGQPELNESGVEIGERSPLLAPAVRMNGLHIVLTVNAAWNVVNFRRGLVASLLEDGHRLTVLAPADDSVAEIIRMGCRFVHLPMDAKGLSPLEGLRLIKRMRRFMAAERPDVVLSFTIKNNIFGAMAARRRGIPFIPNVTGLGTAFLSGGPLQFIAETLYRHAFRRLPVVFFQNNDDQKLFVNRRLVRSHQVRLLPGSGINLQHFAPAPPLKNGDDPVFLMIARLLRDKGVVEFVEAARIVKERKPGARFQLLGPLGTENRSAIPASLVAEWQAENLIEYLGKTDDVRPFIAKADCVVLPSYREGAPRTLIEAAAMARPLIATDVPGCRSVVDDELTGLFCKPRDAASLANTIERFLALPTKAWHKMGLASRWKMEQEFDQGIVSTAYEDAIKTVAQHTASL